ncbi:MAG: bifunctional 3-(3-hydroxy-phenyl)propionate/3-hydroxycinnamic acid hydroxylase [Pseudomonadota bacterium]|nr:bifunctional 3-(3-hydroxy-phenyl)propionate/3-hydroxycinnamic acid hydroxylase [Pseudomonadota bacterium]
MKRENSSARAHHDVVIVGLGPTGATLANILGVYGLDVLVLEREESVYPLPRAVHFDDEAMRVFQSIRLAESIGRDARVNVGTKFVDANMDLMLDWSRPQEIGPLGWHPSYRFHQPDLEAELNRGLAAQSMVTVLRSANVTAVVDNGDDVSVTFDHDGSARSVVARYVVGTDGARSVVRFSMDSGWEDLGFQERWLVIDVQLLKPRPDLGDFTIQTCDSARPTTYVRCPRDWRRWEISLKPDETAEMVTEESFIWPKLRPAITPEEGAIRRKAVYSFESKLATRWRDGRRLIAGDAAHLMPPFLGQGMCTGIRDAANLAWKLAAILKWGASQSLLDSYEMERRDHARIYIETAVRVGEMMNSAKTAEALTHAIRPDGSAQMQSINRGLERAIGPGGDSFAGMRMPQPRLSDGQWLSDAMDGRFAIIGRGTALQDTNLQSSGMALVINADEHGEVADMLDRLAVASVVVRPDFYCFGADESAGGGAINRLVGDLKAELGLEN